MALWDHGIASGRAALARARQEERAARAAHGFLPQTDWWAIQKACFDTGFTQLTSSGGLVEHLVNATADARHVAMLVAPLANLQPFDIAAIARAPMDRSSFLALYVYAVSHILENHGASTRQSPFAAINWDGLLYPVDEISKLAMSAQQRFTFQCGRKHMLYERLEEELDRNAGTPDWFLPSAALRPFQGVEADCNLTFYDHEVFAEPPGYARPVLPAV